MYQLLFPLSALLLLSSCSKTIVDFLPSESEGVKAPATISFDNLSTPFDSYTWSFGDGTTSQDSTPSHTYYLSGQYTVTLTGYTGNKAKRIEKQIVVLPPDECLILIETPYGQMMAELHDETPGHRDNFVKLAEEGFYDSLLFHRVMDGFMIQGGDPNSRNAPAGGRLGTGGPGYQIDAEFVDNKAHIKGAIAAARTGGPSNPQKRSSGSQFYIVDGKPVESSQLRQMEQRHGVPYPESIIEQYEKLGGAPFLDQDYTVFGQVIDGLEVIDEIAKVRTNRFNRPDEDVWMKIRVIK
ncbi:MAG: peptidylprolyl isomerase [Bacteroidota bacterium]